MKPQQLIALAALLVAVAVAATPPTVVTRNGPVFGYLNEQGSYSFKGIPFAAPPVGNLRFMPTQPVANWDAPYNATTFGPGCYSKCNGKFKTLMCAATISEDCLYLNIYTPSLNASEKIPVFFFIHGGMFDWGSGGIPLYEGNLWAAQERMVIVTINYRLNIFGALYTENGPKGNFNILDQRMAMKWVYENIAAFGGDPDRIVLSGQSAGATSVGVHMVAPGSFPYFSRAAMISNPYGLIPLDTTKASQLGEVVLLKLGCPLSNATQVFSCLQSKTVEEIFDASHTSVLPLPNEVLAVFMPWVPVVDGEVVPQQPLEAMANGDSTPVPFYVGTVANETIPFIFGINFNTTVFEMDVALDYIFGIGKGIEIAALYGPPPSNQDDDTRAYFSMILTDYLFYCPSRFAARQQSIKNGNNTHMYFFDEHPSWSIWYANNNTEDPCVRYICHAFDLPTIFDTYYKLPAGFPNPTPGEQAMSTFVQTALHQFAYTGTITGMDWPAYTSDSRVARNISVPVGQSGVLKEYRETYCEYWDSIGYNRW